MKTVVLTICMCCASLVQGIEPNDVNVPIKGFTANMMFTDTSAIGTEENIFGRLGYQHSQVEIFVGAEVQDFDIWEVGFKLYGYNVVQQSSVPFLADIMANFFNPETMEIRGFTGAHWLENRILKEDYTGALLGFEQKEKGSPISLTAEVQYNNTENNKLVGLFGIKIGF